MDKVLTIKMSLDKSNINKTINMKLDNTNQDISMSIPDPYYSIAEKDYEKLINLPKINGVTLIKDKSFEALGLESLANSEIEALLQ